MHPAGPQQDPSESALVPTSSSSGKGSNDDQRKDPSWLRQRLQGPINWAAGLTEGTAVSLSL